MVDELKKFIDSRKIFFGIRECLKKSNQIERAIVSADCRAEIKKILAANKIKFDTSEFSKDEIAKKIGLEFRSEIFGIRR